MRLYLKQGIFAVFSLLALSMPMVAGAAGTGITPVEDIVELDDKPKPKFQLSEPIQEMDSHLSSPSADPQAPPSEGLSTEDAQNLSSLWKTVIARNPVIQYGLKQLATPPELRYAHSSVMTRAVGSLLNGAALLPFMMGADQYTVGASTIGANLVDRAVVNSQKVDPNKLPSDTELVELSGVVQHLQKNLVEHYLAYKSQLTTCVELEHLLTQLHEQRQKVEANTGPLDALWRQHQVDSTTNQLLVAQQASKRHFLILERMVGAEGMKNLRFDGTTLPPPQETSEAVEGENVTEAKSTPTSTSAQTEPETEEVAQ